MEKTVILSFIGLGLFIGGFSQLASTSITLICAIGLGLMLGGIFRRLSEVQGADL